MERAEEDVREGTFFRHPCNTLTYVPNYVVHKKADEKGMPVFSYLN